MITAFSWCIGLLFVGTRFHWSQTASGCVVTKSDNTRTMQNMPCGIALSNGLLQPTHSSPNEGLECIWQYIRPDVSIADPEGAPPQASAGVEAAVDPLEAKKAAEEAEEQRLAEVRRLGTPVTPATFAPWKQRFYAALAAAAERKRCALRRFAFTYA